ncbi:patatin-like phospholipase family protein [Tropicimonas sediminicola]|uniref:Patatin-like phospholipase n=1 Tax=Tropicimonas sediminicola TaxID=1031541 RepID=A0A239J165_9RHOB|nr:patatin-like phospholipase family protein [Tropicimonas sediminicola]SNS99607.1 Patatin-like phospholipase [Tropicimonas sediminicola]
MTDTPLIRLGPGRRQVLAGLAGLWLAGCAQPTRTELSTRSFNEADPLSGWRVPANAGASVWSEHLPAETLASGPMTLAISGGGEDGAFGAGALVGWSRTGHRPAFDVVTGVSVGALIAPFAFLGPSYDDALRRIFTEYDADDFMALSISDAVFGSALYDTAGLRKLLETFVPDSLIDAVAQRHADGARLFVVTSCLETSRGHAWNMGRIAQAGHYDLFRGILRASAALPGVFPPVALAIPVDGGTLTETHVDGGVQMQFLALPAAIAPGRGQTYVLINNTLTPAATDGAHSALGVSQQALTAMIRANALSAVQAAARRARANGVSFAVAAIDPASGIVYDPSNRFDAGYMNALYRHGYERAVGGSLWTHPTGESAPAPT